MTLTPTVYHERDPKRLDPIWYTGSDPLMRVEYRGYTFYAWASGDIVIQNKTDESEEITNRNVDDYRHLTDEDLADGGDWKWINNNWFEISARGKDGEFIDLMQSTSSWDEAYDYLSDEGMLDQHVDDLMSDAEQKYIAKGRARPYRPSATPRQKHDPKRWRQKK